MQLSKDLRFIDRPETILEISKKVTFLEVINKTIIYKFLKDFTNQKKTTNRVPAYKFALSDAKDNTPGPSNRGGKADLPLLSY